MTDWLDGAREPEDVAQERSRENERQAKAARQAFLDNNAALFELIRGVLSTMAARRWGNKLWVLPVAAGSQYEGVDYTGAWHCYVGKKKSRSDGEVSTGYYEFFSATVSQVNASTVRVVISGSRGLAKENPTRDDLHTIARAAYESGPKETLYRMPDIQKTAPSE